MALFRCAFDLRLLTARAGVSRGGGAQSAGYGKQPSSSGSCDRAGGSNTHPDIDTHVLMPGTSSQESFR